MKTSHFLAIASTAFAIATQAHAQQQPAPVQAEQTQRTVEADSAQQPTAAAPNRSKLPLDHGPRATSTPYVNAQLRQREARMEREQAEHTQVAGHADGAAGAAN
jgi:hypothetical protein